MTSQDDSGAGRTTERSRQLVERLAAVDCPAFAHRRETRAGGERSADPIVLAAGEGSTVVDVDGNRYVDLAAGFGAVLLGHGHPTLTKAIQMQSDKLVQGLGDLFASDAKLPLLEALSALHPATDAQVLLGQSGSDAITAALKTATLATGKGAFIAFDGAYHGLGFGPLPACGFQPSFREPFAQQLNQRVRFAPYPGLRGASLDASLSFVRQLLLEGDVAAVLVEPMLGRGGCVIPPGPFIGELCKLVHEHDSYVIADEIWTGLGRCGELARSTRRGAPVDILCFGKGLGGGLPISACVASAEVMEGWTRHRDVIHTSTHAGAPLTCAAALAVLATLHRERLVDRSAEIGATAVAQLQDQLIDCPSVVEVRGSGLMIGIELDGADSAQRAVALLLERGFLVLTGGVGGETLTVTPALTIELQKLLDFGEALRQILAA